MNRPPKNIAFRRSGRLVAIAVARQDAKGRAFWECRCDCGATVVVRVDALTSKRTRSCGCLMGGARTKLSTMERLAKRLSKPRIEEHW